MTFDIDVNEKEGTISTTYESTSILKTVYHINTQHLIVTFAKGKEVTYHPVDISTNRKLMLSNSVGKTFSTLVTNDKKIRFETTGSIPEFERLQKKKRGY